MFFTIGISILIFVCMYFTILLILRATRSEKSNCSKINLNDHNDKSFSQFGQDLFVLKKTGYKKNGYYLEIGVCDGKNGSNTYLLDTKYEWKGLCIDVIMYNMEERTSKQYKGLVSNKVEDVDFVFAEGLSGIKGLNSKWNNHALVQNGKIQKMKTEITQTVLDDYDVPLFVDYLSLDVEGSELSVLQGINHKKHTFGIISIEHNGIDSIRSDLFNFLTEKGYMRVETLGVDDIYVSKKYFHLLC